jgi:hypothetical protein
MPFRVVQIQAAYWRVLLMCSLGALIGHSICLFNKLRKRTNGSIAPSASALVCRQTAGDLDV